MVMFLMMTMNGYVNICIVVAMMLGYLVFRSKSNPVCNGYKRIWYASTLLLVHNLYMEKSSAHFLAHSASLPQIEHMGQTTGSVLH